MKCKIACGFGRTQVFDLIESWTSYWLKGLRFTELRGCLFLASTATCPGNPDVVNQRSLRLQSTADTKTYASGRFADGFVGVGCA